MKIEQITDKITLICGDCMEYMKTLQDKAFSLGIVDVPYGIGADRRQNQRGNKQPGNAKAKSRAYNMSDWDKLPPLIAIFLNY